jgi:hypothetical protein
MRAYEMKGKRKHWCGFQAICASIGALNIEFQFSIVLREAA